MAGQEAALLTVRMTTDVASSGGGVYETGQTYDLPLERAKAWLENGQAEPVVRKAADRRETRAGARRETR